jgi:uncharacterized membrane protein
MKQRIIMIGFILLIIGINLFILTDVSTRVENVKFITNIILFIGLLILIGSLFLSKNKQKKQDMSPDPQCPNCGRPIPSDAKICPYCKKDFEKI